MCLLLLALCSCAFDGSPTFAKSNPNFIKCSSYGATLGGDAPGKVEEVVIDLQQEKRPLYVLPDEQAVWQAKLAAMQAAGLLQVKHQEQLLKADELLALDNSVNYRALQLVFLEPNIVFVHLGDVIHAGNSIPFTGAPRVPRDLAASVHFSQAIAEAAEKRGSIAYTIMGNHDYVFLTEPMRGSFGALRESFSVGEDYATVEQAICGELWSSESFAGYLRRLPVAIRIQDMLLAHTGNPGWPDDLYECGSARQGLVGFDAYSQRVFESITDLPEASSVLTWRQTYKSSPARIRGILGEHGWWMYRPFSDTLETPSPPHLSRMQRYFATMGVHTLIFGHSTAFAEISDQKEVHRTAHARSIPSGEANLEYRMIGLDTHLQLWADPKRSPKHWMMRCRTESDEHDNCSDPYLLTRTLEATGGSEWKWSRFKTEVELLPLDSR